MHATQTEIAQSIYQESAEEVFERLNSSPSGLTQAEAEMRLRQFGRNMIQEVKGRPLILKFAANFTHLMAMLLWVGGIIALIAQLPQLAIAIWMVNVINGSFSFWQEYRAEKATQALRQMLPVHARVLRDGQEQQILAEELVVGDVLLLSEGDHISADARLIQQAQLHVDQSTLTGESTPTSKTQHTVANAHPTRADTENLIFAGTNVTSGDATAVVYATGMNTEFGHIAHLTQSVGDELSPLQKEMDVATRRVTLIAVGVGLIFFVLSVATVGIGLAESFIFALGMIVAFVPEGMLPTVTLSLAMAVQRMVKRHALVKRLSAIETLGCTTVICTDKTGTLTQNQMTVTDLWLFDQPLKISGVGYTPQGHITTAEGQPLSADVAQSAQDALRAAALCSNAHLIAPDGHSREWRVSGDPTEIALLIAARKGGLDLESDRARLPRQTELAFDSDRKRMSTVHRVEGSCARQIAYV
ncbi:MAG: HAD-IC family P-type ATPase, partial [Anaerolineae bacterium]|nr:HAD-IC family P-type ATPase [Anaerolineae bacterium]